MSVIPDIIPYKVYQVYMCYTIRSLFLSCRQEGLKKIRAPKIFTSSPRGYVPKGTPIDILWAFLIKQLLHTSCSVESRLLDMR